MAFVNDSALDAALTVIATANTLHICSSLPATFANVTSTTLGNGAITLGAASDGDVSGRKRQVSAVSAQSVTGNGTATHWALTEGSTLYAAGALSNPQAVVTGNTFSTAAFDIEVRDPVQA
jgi:hypothetical protein